MLLRWRIQSCIAMLVGPMQLCVRPPFSSFPITQVNKLFDCILICHFQKVHSLCFTFSLNAVFSKSLFSKQLPRYLKFYVANRFEILRKSSAHTLLSHEPTFIKSVYFFLFFYRAKYRAEIYFKNR